MPAVERLSRTARVHPATVVSDFEDDLVLRAAEVDRNVAGLGMLRRVANQFLG